MKLSAYWTANFIVDFIKFELVMGVIVGTMLLLNLAWKATIIMYMIVGVSVIPYTYVLSTFFTNQSAA